MACKSNCAAKPACTSLMMASSAARCLAICSQSVGACLFARGDVVDLRVAVERGLGRFGAARWDFAPAELELDFDFGIFVPAWVNRCGHYLTVITLLQTRVTRNALSKIVHDLQSRVCHARDTGRDGAAVGGNGTAMGG